MSALHLPVVSEQGCAVEDCFPHNTVPSEEDVPADRTKHIENTSSLYIKLLNSCASHMVYSLFLENEEQINKKASEQCFSSNKKPRYQKRPKKNELA